MSGRNADKSKVDRFSLRCPISSYSSDLCQSAIDPRETNGTSAGCADRRDEPGVDSARQYAEHDVEGIGVGNPQAVNGLLGNSQSGHFAVDFPTATMNDDDRHSSRCLGKDFRDAPEPPRLLEQLAAEFD